MLRVPLLHPSVTLTSATQLASFSEPLLPTFFPSSHLLFYFPFSFAVLFCLDCFCCLFYSLTLHSLRVAVSSLGGCSFCPCSESRQHMPEPWGSLVSACVHVNVCGTRFLGGDPLDTTGSLEWERLHHPTSHPLSSKPGLEMCPIASWDLSPLGLES